MTSDPKYIHIMPERDIRAHDESPTCWCNPNKDPEIFPNGNEVYTHNKFLPDNHPELEGIAND